MTKVTIKGEWPRIQVLTEGEADLTKMLWIRSLDYHVNAEAPPVINIEVEGEFTGEAEAEFLIKIPGDEAPRPVRAIEFRDGSRWEAEKPDEVRGEAKPLTVSISSDDMFRAFRDASPSDAMVSAAMEAGNLHGQTDRVREMLEAAFQSILERKGD